MGVGGHVGHEVSVQVGGDTVGGHEGHDASVQVGVGGQEVVGKSVGGGNVVIGDTVEIE